MAGGTRVTGAKAGSGELAIAGGVQADLVGDGRALGGADGVRRGLGVGLGDGLDGRGRGLGGLGDGVAVPEADGVGAGVAVGVADGVGDAVAVGVTAGAPDDDGKTEVEAPEDGAAEETAATAFAAPGEQARVAPTQAVMAPRTVSARPAPADIRPPCLYYPDIQCEQG